MVRSRFSVAEALTQRKFQTAVGKLVRDSDLHGIRLATEKRSFADSADYITPVHHFFCLPLHLTTSAIRRAIYQFHYRLEVSANLLLIHF